MNNYMSFIMRNTVIVEAGTVVQGSVLQRDIRGCPAGFAVGALQQSVSFFVFMLFFAICYPTPYRYVPRRLKGLKEGVCVAFTGCLLSFGIALNNLALSYVSLDVNLTIRSCLPLTTLIIQQLPLPCNMRPSGPCKAREVILMVLGVIFAMVFTIAKMLGTEGFEISSHEMFGVALCLASLLCSSLHLTLVGVLGEMKLNVYDTVAYMAIPATLFLIPFACGLRKELPTEWGQVFGNDQVTDFEILRFIWSKNVQAVILVLLSGAFSFGYNIMQFKIVQALSPSAAAFGGNLNKAVLILLTLLLPLQANDRMPVAPYVHVMWLAVAGNAACFGAYSYLQVVAKSHPIDPYHNSESEFGLLDGNIEAGKRAVNEDTPLVSREAALTTSAPLRLGSVKMVIGMNWFALQRRTVQAWQSRASRGPLLRGATIALAACEIESKF
jgi:drug/metabolite transporter (DMT)-like permease